MNQMDYYEGAGSSVLFFGRNKCEASHRLLRKLRNCGFQITYVESKGRGEKLSDDVLNWDGDYILCFRSLFILPKALISKAKIAAINFHPAPPEYPGSGCINFALYDEAEEYGVTAHLMNEKIDSGEILEVRRFPVNKFDDLTSVLARTHSELLNLCSDFIDSISKRGMAAINENKIKSKAEQWNGQARLLKELNVLQTVPLDVSEVELKKIIRATYIEAYPPKIKLHGYNFYLKMVEE